MIKQIRDIFLNRVFYKQYLLLFITANIINIVLYLLSLFLFINRPVFIIEYNLLILLFIIRLPFYVYAFSIAGIFFLDVLLFSSSIFYFNWIDLLDAWKFLYLHEQGIIIIILFTIITIISILGLWKLYKGYIKRIPRLVILIYLFTSTILLFLLDILNGSSLINDKAPLIGKNLTSSISLGSYASYTMQLSTDQQPATFSDSQESSIAFKYFNNKTGKARQLIIVCESWGLLIGYNYETLLHFLKSANKDKYGLSFGNTFFKGSTTSAELRELINKKGNYRYYLNHSSNNDLSGNVSLFDIKNELNYFTMGSHSFSGVMFHRKKWWSNIGIKEVYFAEDVRNAQNGVNINAESSFHGLNDEDAFDFISRKAIQQKKVFAYLLTVNTHIPFKYKFNNKSFDTKQRAAILNSLKDYPEEVSMRELRIFEQIMYFVINLDKGQWDELLIVGDHPPPFSDLKYRQNYNQKRVPYLFLRK